MGTYRGNADRVMAEADLIVERLKNIDTTLGQIKVEYACAYTTLYKAIFSRISREEYRHMARMKLSRTGVQTRFKKGHRTWNKNRKGIHLSPRTEFKKGNRPAKYKAIGEIYIIAKKGGKPCRWIKLSDRGPWHSRRMPYARHVWQKEHGPIPPGLLVIHRDGDTLNDESENLVLATRAENVAHQWATIPGHLRKFRLNAGKASKRRHARNRILKVRFKKQHERERQEEKEHRRLFKTGVHELRGEVKTWWQCTGCGDDTTIPVPPCRKCGHLVFEQIDQPVEFAERVAFEEALGTSNVRVGQATIVNHKSNRVAL